MISHEHRLPKFGMEDNHLLAVNPLEPNEFISLQQVCKYDVLAASHGADCVARHDRAPSAVRNSLRSCSVTSASTSSLRDLVRGISFMPSPYLS